MGMVREVKANIASKHAAAAREQGRTVFLYRHVVPVTSPHLSAPVGDAAEVIEAIERAGWVLVDMAYDGAQSKNGAVLLLFRPPRR